MKFRALQTAWYGMRLLERGVEFEAPEDFEAPWAEAVGEVVKAKPKAKAKEKPKAKAEAEPAVDAKALF